ncbi:hypothetical protein BC937DRAFT_91342, partial [Endogone sp. FLAS-F59071]
HSPHASYSRISETKSCKKLKIELKRTLIRLAIVQIKARDIFSFVKQPSTQGPMDQQTPFMGQLWDETSTVLMELLSSEDDKSPPFLTRRDLVPVPLSRHDGMEDIPLETRENLLGRAIAFLYSWEPEEFMDEPEEMEYDASKIIDRARKFFKSGSYDHNRYGASPLQRRGSFKAFQGKTRQRSGSFPPVVMMHNEYL